MPNERRAQEQDISYVRIWTNLIYWSNINDFHNAADTKLLKNSNNRPNFSLSFTIRQIFLITTLTHRTASTTLIRIGTLFGLPQSLFMSFINKGCVALPWHFKFYILKCKIFLINFLDELDNFKQKIFTLQNAIFFTF